MTTDTQDLVTTIAHLSPLGRAAFVGALASNLSHLPGGEDAWLDAVAFAEGYAGVEMSAGES